MRTTLTTAVPALALLTALTACDATTGAGTSGGTPTTAPPASAPASASAAPASADAGSKPAKGGTAPAKGGACQVDELDVTVAAQPNGSVRTRTAMVVVTNPGAGDCTAPGRFSITLVNAADEAVDVPTRKVDQPGPPEAVKIKAGGSAFAGIKWTPCDKADVSCGVGNTLRFALDGSAVGPAAELEGFPAAESSGITMKSLQVGTLQPSNQGVVAW